MDTNLVIQYTVVTVVILLALGYLVVSIRRKNRRKGPANSCCGCSLVDSCRKKETGKKKRDGC